MITTSQRANSATEYIFSFKETKYPTGIVQNSQIMHTTLNFQLVHGRDKTNVAKQIRYKHYEHHHSTVKKVQEDKHGKYSSSKQVKR